MPAIPLHTAVSYVAAAYLVFFALILVYGAIMATKLSRIETELSELTDLVVDQRASRDATDADLPDAALPPAAPAARADAPAAKADAPKPDTAAADAPKADTSTPDTANADGPKTGAVAR